MNLQFVLAARQSTLFEKGATHNHVGIWESNPNECANKHANRKTTYKIATTILYTILVVDLYYKKMYIAMSWKLHKNYYQAGDKCVSYVIGHYGSFNVTADFLLCGYNTYFLVRLQEYGFQILPNILLICQIHLHLHMTFY